MTDQEWWELGTIISDGSTISLDSFETLTEAIDGLYSCEESESFIDLWQVDSMGSSRPLGLELSKNDLNKIITKVKL